MKPADQQQSDSGARPADPERAIAVTSDHALYAGRVIDDKYRLLAHLGSGGMGTVFRAEHARLGKKYALKFLRSEASGHSHQLRRFEREAQLLAKLAHENIVSLIDMGTPPLGAPYLVLEFIDGRTLREELEPGPLPPHKLCAIVEQIARGLCAAHEAGVVHRDLKPANVMLTQHADGRLLVKLLDFGVARLCEEDADTLTATGHAPGTAAYMSPEQARGEAQLDARTDVYSLGVVAYEALSGARPYDGKTYNEILFRVLNDEHTPLRERRPELPGAACTAVERALSRHARDRFSSPWEFALALRDGIGFTSAEDSFGLTVDRTAGSGIAPRASVAAATPDRGGSKGGARWARGPWGLSTGTVALLIAALGALLGALGAWWALGSSDPSHTPSPVAGEVPSVQGGLDTSASTLSEGTVAPSEASPPTSSTAGARANALTATSTRAEEHAPLAVGASDTGSASTPARSARTRGVSTAPVASAAPRTRDADAKSRAGQPRGSESAVVSNSPASSRAPSPAVSAAATSSAAASTGTATSTASAPPKNAPRLSGDFAQSPYARPPSAGDSP